VENAELPGNQGARADQGESDPGTDRALSDGSYLAKIYPNAYARRKDRNGIVVRVIKYTLDDPGRVGHGEEHTLLTNLLDEKLYPAVELICGYHERWEHDWFSTNKKLIRTRVGPPSPPTFAAKPPRV